MSKQEIMRELFDNKILNVLDIFLQNKTSEFFLKEISDQSGVSLTSCYRIVRKLLKLKILSEVKVSRFVVYKVNITEDTKFLEELVIDDQNNLEEFVNLVKKDPNVEKIILHGAASKDKANILIIGNNLETDFKAIVADFKMNKKFNATALTISPEQYFQMAEMGLYPGKKTILYEHPDGI